jgi:elongation factor 1 alpha-like protein
MSKLQALAAARKKKIDEKRQNDGVQDAQQKVSRLSISGTGLKENIKPGSSSLSNLKRQKASDAPSRLDAQSRSDQPRQIDRELKVEESSKMDIDLPDQRPAEEDGSQEECLVVVPTTPSAFASTLFAPVSNSSIFPTPQSLPLPYTSSPAFDVEVFAKPSPDDIVLTAQAQGSRLAKSR